MKKVSESGFIGVKNGYIVFQAEGFYEKGAHISGSEDKNFHLFMIF